MFSKILNYLIKRICKNPFNSAIDTFNTKIFMKMFIFNELIDHLGWFATISINMLGR
ncbi:MAG: hypothetical protein ACTSUX_05420 [Promethearchaeota archaeon]